MIDIEDFLDLILALLIGIAVTCLVFMCIDLGAAVTADKVKQELVEHFTDKEERFEEIAAAVGFTRTTVYDNGNLYLTATPIEDKFHVLVENDELILHSGIVENRVDLIQLLADLEISIN